MDFAKNASFKSYGIICLPPLPSTLPEELSMDRRNSNEFILRRRVCTLNDSFCRTTVTVQRERATKLLSLACAYHVLVGLTHVHVVTLHNCVQCAFLWLLQFTATVHCVASLPWHANLANKLSMRRGFCTIVFHIIWQSFLPLDETLVKTLIILSLIEKGANILSSKLHWEMP